MDQAHDFMSRVLAWPGPQGPGWCNVHWLAAVNTGMPGRSFRDLDAFMATVNNIKDNEFFKEVYFCLSTQEEPNTRNAKNARFLKALWVDLDVKPGKTYDTLEAALDALLAFVTAIQLPMPTAIVRSGGGFHVYWISDKPLTVEEWQPYADGLVSEIKTYGLLCDAGLTADAARVLRIPGTYNRKLADNPRPVFVSLLRDKDYDFNAEPGLERLKHLVKPVSAPVTAGFPDFAKTPMDPAFAGIPANPLSDIYDENILLKPERVEKDCLHFKDCRATGGEKHSEPLWALTLLATSFFENGEALAHKYSKGYPAYSPEETQQKYESKLKQRADKDLGWPSCTAFEAEGANCRGCPLYGKIRSPLNLAQRVPDVTTYLNQIEGMELPEGYTFDVQGWIAEVVPKTTKLGVTMDTYKPLFMCRLRNPMAQRGLRRAITFETSLDKDQWGLVDVGDDILFSDTTLLKQLRLCGVKTYVPNESRIRHFMTSWMAKLDQARDRIETVPFGWLREEGGREIGFAYGGCVFRCDGTTQRGGFADEKLGRFYKPCGSREPWLRALKIITDQRRPALETIIAMSLAAPLISLVGKHNCIGNAWSHETGAHKTTAQIIGLAIWGNPRLTKENPMSSVKGVIHKLGMLKNLPVYWDEILSTEKMDAIRAILNVVTEGSGATVLTQGREFHTKDEWQTLMMLSSNLSLMENIMQNTRTTSAQLERVFEFYVDKAPATVSDSEMSILLSSLDHNYGQVGLDYARFLGTQAEATRVYVKRVLDTFSASVMVRTEERFRVAMAACIFAGAEIANKNLGTSFNLEDLWAFLRNEFVRQRTTIKEANVEGGGQLNTAAAMTEFFKAHTRNTLWIEKLPWVSAGRPPPVLWIAGPNREHPDPVHIRISTGDRTIEVSRARLLRYFQDNSHDGFAVIRGLTKHFAAKEEHRINLATGSGVMGGREIVFKLPVPAGSPFTEDVFRHTSMDDRPEDAKVDTPEQVTAPETAVPAMAPMPEPMAPIGNGHGNGHTASPAEEIPTSLLEALGSNADMINKLLRNG